MLLQNQLNKTTADAFCTVITLGFLALDKRRAQPSKFLFENDAQNESLQEHENLRSLMLTSKIEALHTLFPDCEQQQDKANLPFIYAKRNALDHSISEEEIHEVLKRCTDKLEAVCNMVFPDLKGAYIGGIANRANVTLICPSRMYPYPIPNYIDQNEPGYLVNVNQYYKIFVDTTKKILDLFAVPMEKLSDPADPENPVELAEPASPVKIELMPTVQELNTMASFMQNTLTNNELFASVHGLITSMTIAPPKDLRDDNFNVELALSHGTKKVASCIPCAIFAMSQNAPASYTHLGRGDYWNLPTTLDREIRDSWTNFVNLCYEAGINLVYDFLPREWNSFFDNISGEPEDYIADVFLSALTFPGSFQAKMLTTLQIIEAL